MSAEILKADAALHVREAAVAEIRALGFPPKVVAIHNPESAAARYYLRAQRKTCLEASVGYEVRTLEPGWDLEKVLRLIHDLNRDPGVTGITVHTPLPAGMNPDLVMSALAPAKDIEGIHPENLGRLAFGEHHPAPCAASAAVELARAARPSFRGLDAVVVGRSALVGKAIALLLLQSKAEAPTPTLCHTATADLGAHTRRADLLFAAAGRAGLIRGTMVKPGAVVIDVGINETPEGKLVGDVVFDEAREVAGVLTPVPGGVGPVCHYILLRNIAACAHRAARDPARGGA
ncbi:MAG TPA: bifunctional 5,10-methylenetetrahydrofolate dehydrogenase/5,10-methenyltetrahydrofolate cyclohydrolase [Planctomycetota bacterium]|nr:bifunctional 5,10-methylenetetrahydrofolate dehydrogenase/5,10-methenyltetrahydrofolate cyclohydrolase [Planctomycetota bacterium]